MYPFVNPVKTETPFVNDTEGAPQVGSTEIPEAQIKELLVVQGPTKPKDFTPGPLPIITAWFG